ncbi:MAG: saccharopine dehydrogenase NADP-binding domain-containing protein [Woeseiaceae bacterium]|nr:saccharopine dehydrogenase NADP-binding domain-containing protein [Woeseiaceae bacterium]
MNDREFDVVVWGATGFTGSLVAEYLLAQYGIGGDLRWAIGGRSESKLAALKERLGSRAESLPTIVADSMDKDALSALAARTRVVLTTVGPYAKYGTPLLEACVEAGTSYCDLCAEVQWLRRMMDTYGDRAAETGARIVHCCGFDSIPSDIGVWYLQREAKRRHGEYCEKVLMVVKAVKGGASGGTAASIVNLVKETREDPEARRFVAKPYSLNPEGKRDGPRVKDQQGPVYNKALKAWTAPFIMAVSNTRIVRRSNALQDFIYGEDFVYDETIVTGPGAAGRIKALSISAGLGLLLVNAAFTPTRYVLERFILPKPGEGPDANARANGFFNVVHVGTLHNGETIKVRVTGDRDPGYGSTSKMLAESAVCLARNELAVGGGFWTTASAMGEPLHKRLVDNAGLTFDVVD